ncbi:glycine zipper family protein [Oceanicaulis alexandrii]|uniref:glycine zipper family protein n=1 Tax=Oceanicaulis TaxID=153232 RepID=UPI0035CEBF4B
MKRSLTARTALCALRGGCALLAGGVAALALGACAGGGADYAPVVDGPRSVAYQADLQACQALARERALMNADTRTDMAIGAGIGALAGLADDDVTDTEGALAGALVGAAVGGMSGALETRDERRQMVVDCLRLRGHRAIG